MPIYEYQCADCGRRFEAMQKMADAPLTECRLCGKAGRVSKCVTAAGFQLKGSGWYVTDFRDGKKSGGDAKSDAKADGKPEAKTDSPASGTADAAATTTPSAPTPSPAPAPATSTASTPAASSAG